MTEQQSDPALQRLQEAIAERRIYLSTFEKPSAKLTFETLRVLDDINCRDLMFPGLTEKNDARYRGISTWGANHALRRVIPRTLCAEPFAPHPSSAKIQDQANDFVFNCGVLELAERYEGWLREGVVSGNFRRHQIPGKDQGHDVLVLRSAMPSYSDEEIGRAGLRWAGDQIWRKDRPAERKLERQYLKLRRELEVRVNLLDGWQMTYSSTPEINEHFLEWAKLYLRRIFSQDLIGENDIIGGRPFSRYIDVLTIISAWSQRHLAYASILGGRYGPMHIRNFITTCAARDRYILNITKILDADTSEISEILKLFTLTSENLDVHTKGGDMNWAPIVQTSQDTLILPAYGIDVNPFLFLLSDLRFRYEKDWFRVANEREHRWIAELEAIFQGSRYSTHGRNLRLREQGKDVTDIDFAIIDRKTGELGLFQLKWQHPIGMDNRGRRSTGKNLIIESNRWIQTVSDWLGRHGIDEMMRRLSFEGVTNPSVHLFVLGRYQAHMTGFDNRDARATWSDWGHFRRAKVEGHRRSISQIASALRSTLARATAAKQGESLMVPIGELSVILNPAREPPSPKE